MSQIKQLTSEQLNTFINFIQISQLEQAENLLIEQINLSPTAAKNLVQLLHKDVDALQMFKEKPQILDQEHKSQVKTESKAFEFSFHSSKIKMTDKDGKATEINDQSPEWDTIKKQFNIDLTQPDALSSFAKSFMDGNFQMNNTESKGFDSQSFDSNPSNNQTFDATQNTSIHTSNMPNSGVEDLTKSKKSNSILLAIGLIVLVGICGLYYFQT